MLSGRAWQFFHVQALPSKMINFCKCGSFVFLSIYQFSSLILWPSHFLRVYSLAPVRVSVHIIRLEFFSSDRYRGDVFSKVDVVRDPHQHIRAELPVKRYDFLAMEGLFTLHHGASKY